jgi:hypothetical protein
MRRALAAGVSDAGVSSAANLLIGLYATRSLDAVTLGVYALLYSGLFFATVAPTTAVATPLEVQLVGRPAAEQLASLPTNLLRCLPVSALTSATVATVVGFATFGTNPRPILLLTASMASTISPLQDHTRRMLHQVGRSKAAAAVSLVNLSVVLTTVTAGFLGALPRNWVPFGAMVLGNSVSLGVGLGLARRWSRGATRRTTGMRIVLRSGSWLLIGGLATSAPGLFSGLVLNGLHRTSELGQAEASRVLSQPIGVMALGLAAVLRPRILLAVQARRSRELFRLNRVLHGLLAACGLALVVVVGYPWAFSPIPRVFPLAYRQEGLVAAWVVSAVLGFLTMSAQWQLTAAGRERRLCRASIIGGSAQILVVVLTASFLGAYSLPLSAAVAGLAMTAASLSDLPRSSGAPLDGQAVPGVDQAGKAGLVELEPSTTAPFH